ncbi:hypothetical protein Poli38472_004342 [Pythium oligandrum]|uniref:Copper transport protein n=1 Tax=Pythium oligandrum TaxID=41045 RepID=A0A8K1CAS6_PYTOL|nr:hypothetical protein Poli38472_004342 [Pythium oligandrum]|eukprot:TMW59273.1 hypothetical protein Poli38472_004342 [Pythium oligandrum]
MAPFCIGAGIIMGSDGLQLTSVDPNGDCIMLWTNAFTINSAARAVLANFGVAVMAITAQYLATASANRIQRARTYAKQKRAAVWNGMVNGSSNYASVANASAVTSTSAEAVDVLPRVSNWEHFGDSLLHGLRIFIAYLLMLAVMTYDVAVVCSIVVGFVVGYFVFTKDSTKVPDSADPCCCS